MNSIKTVAEAAEIVKVLMGGGYRETVAIYFVSDSLNSPDLAPRLLRWFGWINDEPSQTVDQWREWSNIDGDGGHWA